VNVARRLAARGIGAAIPDLPGCGESVTPIGSVRLADWREAFAAACATCGAIATVSLRAAALFDGVPDGATWRLSLQDGARLLREMVRVRVAGAREDGRELTSGKVMAEGREQGVELAGHWLGPLLFADLEGATPSIPPRLRTVRLGGDVQPCDLLIDAAPPWRRAEPGYDPVLPQRLTDDILDWLSTCAA
jgi:hypothetical protein